MMMMWVMISIMIIRRTHTVENHLGVATTSSRPYYLFVLLAPRLGGGVPKKKCEEERVIRNLRSVRI